MTSIARRLLQGDPRRKTRLHDFEGNPISLTGLVDLVPCVWSTVLLKLGIRSSSPWLPYPAVRHLDELVRPSWRVLEFGAGASTVWLAHRAAHVVSREHDPGWHARVKAKLAKEGRGNVDVGLFTRREEYAALDQSSFHQFDLVMVDGAWRDACARTAVQAVRSGGYVYMDNSDVPDPDHRMAVQTILHAASESRRFIGLCPGHIAANQGLLIRAA